MEPTSTKVYAANPKTAAGVGPLRRTGIGAAGGCELLDWLAARSIGGPSMTNILTIGPRTGHL